MKDNKGITLVALVVTIVVLIILAVIAIRQVTNRDMVAEAQEAKTRYAQAENNEESELQETVDFIREIKQSQNAEEGIGDGPIISPGFQTSITFTVDGDLFSTSPLKTWESFANSTANFEISDSYVTYKGRKIMNVLKTDIIKSQQAYVTASGTAILN